MRRWWGWILSLFGLRVRRDGVTLQAFYLARVTPAQRQLRRVEPSPEARAKVKA